MATTMRKKLFHLPRILGQLAKVKPGNVIWDQQVFVHPTCQKGPQMSLHTTFVRLEEVCGEVFDRKPAKVELTEGKKYAWCTCGHSSKQPFCDGSHKRVEGPVKFQPVRFTVETGKDYFLCNCKQTKKQPYCDGTHKTLT